MPRNSTLEATAIDGPDAAASVWHRYLTEWTRWNHVRALTSMATAVSFIVAIVLG